METAIAKQLVDKIYEKRKAAALDLEKQIRECHQQGDQRRIIQIIEQLLDMFKDSSNALHIRNGGLIGLAGTAIALGVDIAPYLDKFVSPLLDCFVDPENRIRYFSAECLYNIAKVAKGEILVYFNEIFDALSKLAADSELSVKNGAELLDRLLKDIVAECASVYIPQYPETEKIIESRDEYRGVLVPYYDGISGDDKGAKRAFSLAHFIPLLRERIYVVSPFTRSYLVSWISVLDSVPELELISYLPEFLDGLLKYLSDPIEDVRVATESLLGEFLRELHDVTLVNKKVEETKLKREEHRVSTPELRTPTEQMDNAVFLPEDDSHPRPDDETTHTKEEADYRDTGAWVPGQGLKVDYAALVEILIQQLDSEHDEIQQSTALRWIAEFLNFTPEVMVPFTPRLIPAILPNLAHHVPMIQSAAVRTNRLLFNVIQNLPSPSDPLTRSFTEKSRSTAPSRQTTISKDPANTPSENSLDNSSVLLKSRASIADVARASSDMASPPSERGSRPHSPLSFTSQSGPSPNGHLPVQPEEDLFDYQVTVSELTVQFLSEFVETRVAALKWLIMLHQKAPKKILAMDDGTFPALLKTLSDSSEEVIKHDLQLIAQISSSSEEGYFKAFMINLLELFSTDRRLLDTRGSLIIRQLCLNLNTERIYRTFAEILEKEEDLEFASDIVQKLNLILITSPELADFRKKLKSLETRQDGQALFTTLYRSWCHNPVSVFALCLLAQAYEHASNLLYIFADLEITVQLLVQVDKLVQLIESPVFTYLRLQLLEPEKHPHLFKCLYGILMLLPQSLAFVSLRNRLNAVNSAGFLHIAPRSSISPLANRSKIGREEIKWQELLMYFRQVQARHEKARRFAMGADSGSSPVTPVLGHDDEGINVVDGPGSQASRGGATGPGRPVMRRRATGPGADSPTPPSSLLSRSVLSPLNPQARARQSAMVGPVNSAAVGGFTTASSGAQVSPKHQNRRSIGSSIGLIRK